MPTYDAVNIGDEIPSITKTPGRFQLVQYAAGSGDFNPLHYDADFPQAKAIGDNIVHGRMKYASIGQVASDWLAHTGTIRAISCQYRGMDLQGMTFICRGVVKDKRIEDGAKIVELELWTEAANGQKTTPGSAIVVLNS